MNAPTPARFTDEALDDIRLREPISAVFERHGAKLRRAGRHFECLCPFHAENTASCHVDDGKGVFLCRGCGEKGDVFDAVMRLSGCSFPEAVERLGGTRELTELDRARIVKRAKERQDQAEAEARRGAERAARQWSEGRPLTRDTAAHAYLEARGVCPPAGADLRFAPALAYWGFANSETSERTQLGDFPALLGAIRTNAGALIGVHRTYLDPVEPVKLSPPGCPKRNRAKKFTGEHMGGSIALSPRRPRMAYGEGIETTLSWRVLAGAAADGFGLAALASLGNVAGGATKHVPHPTRRLNDGRPASMPSGVPDPDRPGFVPGPGVVEAVLLGDGDSEPVATRAQLLTAARRWGAAGVPVSIDMAPPGQDWNDVLMAEAEGA